VPAARMIFSMSARRRCVLSAGARERFSSRTGTPSSPSSRPAPNFGTATVVPVDLGSRRPGVHQGGKQHVAADADQVLPYRLSALLYTSSCRLGPTARIRTSCPRVSTR